VSKKHRTPQAEPDRTATAADTKPATDAATETAVTPATEPIGGTAAEEALSQLLDELLSALRAGDLLWAELATAHCISLPGTEQDKSAAIFINMAAQSKKPEDAALLRLIMALGSPTVKRAASQQLAALTAAGIYPADWVTEAGRATPIQAWRHSDTFEETEVITVTYSYGGSEHAVAVTIETVDLPLVISIRVTDNLADVLPPAGYDREEQITLTGARRRMQMALDLALADPEPSPLAIAYLPVARSRLRRLPAPEPLTGPVYSAADRAALVDEFMKSPEAADAVAADQDATRFWAQILTGYSSRIPDEPPGHVGPLRLEYILDHEVPAYFQLTQAQRQDLQPAVAAWTRWSAAYRGLDDKAGDLAAALSAATAGFDQAYDDPDNTDSRNYLTDLATSDADLLWLRDNFMRRKLAMPLPTDREARAYGLDATVPDDRRAYTAAEFAECPPPDGVTSEQLIAAAQRVVEELWSGEPPTTWLRAQQLRGTGADRHDIIHVLMNL
jgi:hypothetical protein